MKFVDLRFTDTKGKMQHVTADVSCVDEAMFSDGYAFDGSSIAGWKGIEASDMMLMPDAGIGPPRSVLRPDDAGDLLRRARAHRPASSTSAIRARIAKKAEAYMKSTGIGDTRLLRPRGRVLHLRRRALLDRSVQHRLPASTLAELPTNTGTEYEMGNLGHRPRTKGGYFPVPPIDSCQDIRSEMLSVHGRDGRRRREAPPRGGRRPARARHQVRPDDHTWPTIMQIYKYVIHRSPRPTARRRRFMPKPIFGDNGSGMHVHQSIWKGGTAGVRRQQVRRPFGDLPLLHRRHPEARQGDQRLHQPDDQLLQASGAGLRGPRAARLLGAQPLGLVPHPARVEPEGQAHRGPLPRSRRQSLSRLRGDAHGRPRRHPEQDPSRRSDGQEPLRPAAGRARQDPDGVRHRCARRSTASTRTAASSRWAAS